MSSYEDLKADAANMVGSLCNAIDDVEAGYHERGTQIRKLEAERDELKVEVKKWLNLDHENAREYRKMRDQRDELRAECDEAISELSPEVPRIITADEPRVGQVVAVHNVENAEQVGHWEVVELHSEFWIEMARADTDSIVLLEDAPEEPEPAKPELPTEAGAIIQVTEADRFHALELPQLFIFDGGWYWTTLDNKFSLISDAITAWNPVEMQVID